MMMAGMQMHGLMMQMRSNKMKAAMECDQVKKKYKNDKKTADQQCKKIMDDSQKQTKVFLEKARKLQMSIRAACMKSTNKQSKKAPAAGTKTTKE